ncbi:hypothetical protein QN277_009062 [Acacia crassicarpa]|uniref:PGG domain-containing protein n=1 Tax=Acacia crassicarpa TaxID=499986 RepID=A0AAE1ISQ4_9FABA|nr:hypothetical protein QN277_009062 [Acacia crassicarpa]
MESREEENPKFDPIMEELQRIVLHSEWDYFKKDHGRNAADLIKPFNMAGNTAIHIAAKSNNPDLLRELLDLLPEDSDRRQGLRTGNAHENTLLHQVVLCKNVDMVNTVLSYEMEKNLKQPEDGDLLELRNDLGETPVYIAAKYGRLKMLKHMAKYINDMEPHFYNRDFYPSILHIAIIGQHFDVAMWLSKQKGIEKGAFVLEGIMNAKEYEKYGLSCLQLLSSMPSVFRSHHSQAAGFTHNLIYACIPNKGYDEEDEDEDEDDGKFIRGNGDIESGKKKIKKSISPSPVSSRIYYAFWKLVAEEWDYIKEIWKIKKQNMQAKELADFLVSRDKSWRNTKRVEPRTHVVLPVIQLPNISETKKALLEKTYAFRNPIECKDYTPLLLAASTGIIEIVDKIIEEYPDSISHISQHDHQNVLHTAVKHRQKSIYKLLKKYKLLKVLGTQIASRNYTLLHQVATLDFYDVGNQPGVVFQLQEELHWFERVKEIVPGPFQLYRNEDKLTAKELFDLEHLEMLKEARVWIKETAQSCSAVSVLVATVVFAAAYTVPGGTDGHGMPNLLNSPLFLFFTVMDVVGLATSLVSVMMFLSILTSSFQMQKFYKSLPRKLTMGFTLLFVSLTTTMLAFGSTILLTIRMENNKWSSILVSISFFLVTLFGLTQYPIVMAFKYKMKRLWKDLKKIIPNDVMSMSTKRSCKRDYSKYL